jgi:hypothetical protein
MTLPTSPEDIAELKELGRLRTEQRDRAEAEVRELRAALRPFAEAYREGGFGDDAVHTDLVHLYTRESYLARAAELVPEENT